MQIEEAFVFARNITPNEPPVPPTPIPDWWINSYGVSPVHSVGGYYPYLYNYYNHTYKLYGNFHISGTPDIGLNALEVPLFRGDNHYDIPLVDGNGDETTFYLRFSWGEYEDLGDEYWNPIASVSLYNGSTFIEGNSDYWELDTEIIQKVYLYAGADTFPAGTSGNNATVVYGGFACIGTNDWVYHGGGAIDLNWIWQTYGVRLSDEWLTRN